MAFPAASGKRKIRRITSAACKMAIDQFPDSFHRRRDGGGDRWGQLVVAKIKMEAADAYKRRGGGAAVDQTREGQQLFGSEGVNQGARVGFAGRQIAADKFARGAGDRGVDKDDVLAGGDVAGEFRGELVAGENENALRIGRLPQAIGHKGAERVVAAECVAVTDHQDSVGSGGRGRWSFSCVAVHR